VNIKRFLRLLERPVLMAWLVFLPFTLWTAWVQMQGLEAGTVLLPVVEYWVHGIQPDWAWVPFVHPPLYSGFMNAIDWYAGASDQQPSETILVQGALIQSAVVLLFAYVGRSWMSPRFTMVLLVLITLLPSGVRPFEQYPISKLLLLITALAIVRFARTGTKSAAVAVLVAGMATVLMNLLTWFAIGGLLASLFFFLPHRRKRLALVSVLLIMSFMSTTYPGLYEALAFERDPSRGMAEMGGLSLGWSNYFLFLPLCLWLVPAVRRHDPFAAGLGYAGMAFTVVVLLMQHFQLADGQGYPDSYHYFVIIDPILVLGALTALWTCWQLTEAKGTQRLLQLGIGAMVVSQLVLYLRGQDHIWLNPHWFWILGLPS